MSEFSFEFLVRLRRLIELKAEQDAIMAELGTEHKPEPAPSRTLIERLVVEARGFKLSPLQVIDFTYHGAACCCTGSEYPSDPACRCAMQSLLYEHRFHVAIFMLEHPDFVWTPPAGDNRFGSPQVVVKPFQGIGYERIRVMSFYRKALKVDGHTAKRITDLGVTIPGTDIGYRDDILKFRVEAERVGLKVEVHL